MYDLTVKVKSKGSPITSIGRKRVTGFYASHYFGWKLAFLNSLVGQLVSWPRFERSIPRSTPWHRYIVLISERIWNPNIEPPNTNYTLLSHQINTCVTDIRHRTWFTDRLPPSENGWGCLGLVRQVNDDSLPFLTECERVKVLQNDPSDAIVGGKVNDDGIAPISWWTTTISKKVRWWRGWGCGVPDTNTKLNESVQ